LRVELARGGLVLGRIERRRKARRQARAALQRARALADQNYGARSRHGPAEQLSSFRGYARRRAGPGSVIAADSPRSPRA